MQARVSWKKSPASRTIPLGDRSACRAQSVSVRRPWCFAAAEGVRLQRAPAERRPTTTREAALDLRSCRADRVGLTRRRADCRIRGPWACFITPGDTMAANYEFTIHTGDQATAGTDSNIFVILHGERGTTDEVRLNGYI